VALCNLQEWLTGALARSLKETTTAQLLDCMVHFVQPSTWYVLHLNPCCSNLLQSPLATLLRISPCTYLICVAVAACCRALSPPCCTGLLQPAQLRCTTGQYHPAA
jgi:hypothetical protein